MGISWLSVLAAVPWSEVIRNAPKVAEGAKKLWSTVRKDNKNLACSVGGNSADPQVRIATLEAAVDELSKQMQASAELIKALAEQNAQLVQRIESNRRRTVGLTVVVLLLLAGLLFVMQRLP